MSYKLIGIFAGSVMLCGCETVPPQAGSLDAAWGEPTRYNAAIQTINPEPVYTAADAQPGDNGEKAANATKRYRTDQVKEPEPASTTRKAGGSGGGGSGPR